MKLHRILLALLLCALPLAAQQPTKNIEDNSFLIEEAFNQEDGVIQYINTFRRDRGGFWEYTFTNEIPVGGQKHQFSYTIPLANATLGTGLGDIFLNYRYQAVRTEKLLIAPRASLLLPTGDEKKGRGAGGVGLQFNLPVSALLAPRFITHVNAGATFTPRARNAAGQRAATQDYFAGQSLIWLAKPRFNVMFEALYENTEAVVGAGLTARRHAVTLNPGLRWAHNLKSGLQIVPGIAFPVGVGPSRGGRGVFLYLSLEK
jgi:hypothetical protein